MANDAIGFEVIINDELLNKVKQADGKLKQLQHTTEQVSKSMIESFKSIGARGLDELIGKVKILNTNIANTNLSNLGGGVTNLGQQATKSIESVKNLVEVVTQLNNAKQKLNNVGDEQKRQTAQDNERKVVIDKIQMYQKMFDTIENREKKRIAQEERSEQKRQQLHDREIQRLQKIEQARAKADSQQRKRDYNFTMQKGDTFEHTMRVSNRANSINQEINAIKLLEQEKKKLKYTDEDYKKKVQQLDEALLKHKSHLESVGTSYHNVKQKSSNLLNISDQLQRRLALVFSVSQVTGYIKKLIAVRGEFELQQRSLQAIIGNKDKANDVFDKVTKLAVQSPFQLKDLVTYTKQLAAYKIETDKLYDSTKMLADISAGVGVDMSRMVLAYGQVASANYLRGTELRQFSEAGVNVLGGLADYYTELKGRVVEVDEVFDMVSRRMVRFEHVDEVLRRMTQSGGEFYNMQAIQAQTLKGQVSNLQDSLDIMLNEIGKANEGTLKFFVALTRDLVENWRVLEVVMTDVGIAIAGLGIMKFIESVNLMRSGLEAAALGGNRLAKVFTRLRDAFKSLWALITLNPLTIATGIVAVIGAITYAVYKYNKAVDEQNKKYDETSVALQNQILLLRKQQTEYHKASEEIKKAYDDIKKDSFNVQDASDRLNEAQGKQAQILGQLKREYPEVYNQVIQNKDSQEQWTKAIEETNRQLLFQMALEQGKKGDWWHDTFDKNVNDAIEELNEYRDAIQEVKNIASFEGVKIELAYKKGEITEESYKEFRKIQEELFNAEGIENFGKAVAKTQNSLARFFNSDGIISEWAEKVKDAIDDADSEFLEYHTDLTTLNWNLENNAEVIKNGWLELGLTSADLAEEEGQKSAMAWMKGIMERFNIQDNYLAEDVKKWIEKLLGVEFNFKIDIEGGSNAGILEWVSRTKDELKEIIDQMPEDIKYLDTLMGKDISFKMTLPSDAEKYDEYVKEVQLWINNLKELREKALNQKKIGELINDEEFKKIEQAIVLAEKYGNVLGIDPKIKKDGDETDSMLEERLRVLREMYDAYRDLNKTLDETKSKEGVIAKYGDAFKQAFGKDLKDSMFDPSFFVNDDEYIKALDKLLNLTADAKERLKVQLEQGRVEWDIILDAKMASDAKLKENVEKMFSDYSSSIELDKMDISPEFAKAFFDIDTTSLEDLKKKLQEIQPKFTGDDMVKQYEEYLKKVEELEVKAQQDRLKEYLKYTRDAIGERAKLKLEELQKLSDIEQTFNKAESDKNAQIAKLQKEKPSGYEEKTQQLQEEIKLLQSARQQAKDGLHEETETAIQKLEWEAFKSSETFASMFNDLDNVSSKALGSMINMLERYRTEWTDLPLSEMKEVINLLDKMEEAQAQKDISANPFKFARDTKREIKEYGGVEKAEEDMLYQQQKQMNLQEEIAQLEYIVQLKNEGEDLDKAILEYESKYSTFLKHGQKSAKERLTNAKNEVKESQKREKTAKDIVESEEKLKASYQKQAEYMGDSLDMAKDLYEALGDLYEALGGDKDSPVAIFADMGMSMAETVVNTIMLQMQLQAATIQAEAMGVAMNCAMGIVGWIVMAIQLIVEGIKAIVAVHDNKLQKQIDTWAEGVETLQKEYEKLEKVIEHAISFETYRSSFNEMQDNLMEQIDSLNRMIAAEQEKKKTDDDQIKEWKEEMEEAQESLLEIQEQFYEDMGGFGSGENYKSAAEDFIDAWYSAFKETGNGLEGLKEQWDEYFDNIIKKQILMRAGQKYIQPLLEEVDKAVGESGEITSQEMNNLRRMAEETSVGLNEVLTTLAETLGGFGTGTSSELEGLSKSIQGVTEVTAQALEAILNSMRLYVIDSNKRLTDIAERVLNFENPQNPILAELKQQTEYIEDIRTFLNSVIHRQGNPSIRVTM